MKILELETDETPTGEWATYEVFRYTDGRTVMKVNGAVTFDGYEGAPTTEIRLHGYPRGDFTGLIVHPIATIELPKLSS